MQINDLKLVGLNFYIFPDTLEAFFVLETYLFVI